MNFCDKLNLLFEVTHAKGKELANALYVTPPQITKMRKGHRPLPRDKSVVRFIALFFARRCNDLNLLKDLSQTLNNTAIQQITNEDDLTDVVSEWLQDDSPRAYGVKRTENFLRKFNFVYEPSRETDAAEPSKNQFDAPAPIKNDFLTFFGNEGKRNAMLFFLQHIARRKQPLMLNILTDEKNDWVTENADFADKLQASLSELSAYNCHFRRIVGPLSDLNQAFDSLNRWLPLYFEGKVSSYYYKKLRDNLNRVTIFVVENVVVMFSFSCGDSANEQKVTFLTADTKTVNYMYKQFESYLNTCLPIMKIFDTNEADAMFDCMVRYESIQADSIQFSDSLSFITLPWETVNRLYAYDQEKKEKLLRSLAVRNKIFRANLEHYTFVDIIKLADLNSILNDKVSIPAGNLLDGKIQCYTAKEYLSHLKSILFLLEHNKNYFVSFTYQKNDNSAIIYSKEGVRAILARDTYPFSLFEVSEFHLVNAFTEYLHRLLAPDVSLLQAKSVAIKELRKLVTDIELHLIQKSSE